MIESQLEAFSERLEGMDEEQLKTMLGLFKMAVAARLNSGQIPAERADELGDLLERFDEAMNLPLEIRIPRMREIMDQLISLGTS